MVCDASKSLKSQQNVLFYRNVWQGLNTKGFEHPIMGVKHRIVLQSLYPHELLSVADSPEACNDLFPVCLCTGYIKVPCGVPGSGFCPLRPSHTLRCCTSAMGRSKVSVIHQNRMPCAAMHFPTCWNFRDF